MIPKFVLAALAVATMSSSVTAQEYLCVEDAAIGFNWEGGKWAESRFTTSTRLIKKLPLTDMSASFCARKIEDEGHRTEVVYDDYSGLAYGCYQNSIIGQEPRSADLCREIYKKDNKEMWAIRCDGLVDYDFAPNGEYIAVAKYSIPDPGMRDSLAMIVGACSQLK